jgi:hypothetical protein
VVAKTTAPPWLSIAALEPRASECGIMLREQGTADGG